MFGHKLQKGSSDYETITTIDNSIFDALGLNSAILDVFPWARFFGKGALYYEELVNYDKISTAFMGKKIQQAKVCCINIFVQIM